MQAAQGGGVESLLRQPCKIESVFSRQLSWAEFLPGRLAVSPCVPGGCLSLSDIWVVKLFCTAPLGFMRLSTGLTVSLEEDRDGA